MQLGASEKIPATKDTKHFPAAEEDGVPEIQDPDWPDTAHDPPLGADILARAILSPPEELVLT